MTDRRKFIIVVSGFLALAGAGTANAGEGGGDSGGEGGGGNSGSGGGGSSGSGGQGGGNSGPGGGGGEGGGDDDNNNDNDRDDDQDDARRARELGQVESLRRILSIAKKKYGGRVVDVRLRRQSGKFYYDIKMVGRDGAVRRMKLDAKTGSSMAGAGS